MTNKSAGRFFSLKKDKDNNIIIFITETNKFVTTLLQTVATFTKYVHSVKLELIIRSGQIMPMQI